MSVCCCRGSDEEAAAHCGHGPAPAADQVTKVGVRGRVGDGAAQPTRAGPGPGRRGARRKRETYIDSDRCMYYVTAALETVARAACRRKNGSLLKVDAPK